MAKLLIFDFDGTLFHTGPGIHKAVNLTLQDIGHPELSYHDVISCVGQGLIFLLKKLELKIHMTEENLRGLAKNFRTHYNNLFLNHSVAYDGVVEFLQKWPFELAIASNKDEYYIKELIKHPPWSELNWIGVYGGNSLPTRKPEPEMIEKILEVSQYTPQEAVIIGDGQPDIEVALRMGIKSIAVSYGYEPIEKLMALGAHHRIDQISELPTALKTLFP